jgi:phosphoribosylformylglycinamidine (FGAM) synthase-like amidotransferase family enzyme
MAIDTAIIDQIRTKNTLGSMELAPCNGISVLTLNALLDKLQK